MGRSNAYNINRYSLLTIYNNILNSWHLKNLSKGIAQNQFIYGSCNGFFSKVLKQLAGVQDSVRKQEIKLIKVEFNLNISFRVSKFRSHQEKGN